MSLQYIFYNNNNILKIEQKMMWNDFNWYKPINKNGGASLGQNNLVNPQNQEPFVSLLLRSFQQFTFLKLFLNFLEKPVVSDIDRQEGRNLFHLTQINIIQIILKKFCRETPTNAQPVPLSREHLRVTKLYKL